MEQATYSYRLRPAYGGGDYMIEFMRGDERQELLTDVLNAITLLQPDLKGSADLLFLVSLEINTNQGAFTYTVDEWGGVFIDGSYTLLSSIHEILEKDSNFEFVPTNPEDFK
ncbi:hypothetical protein K6119_04625 [Paracrocinitomix mangrovi]|uniref:hypothetical protein n=1 Tax=Paracrocinitomix mangrovi TaxID=2862509 RepID=UPI001C8D919F|nr:hypothetical protein [Paracrocinitomix mangrovi]UKN02800.1 hypothetical protein K6119_04625 [Paracrocinitomix mangrovi]